MNLRWVSFLDCCSRMHPLAKNWNFHEIVCEKEWPPKTVHFGKKNTKSYKKFKKGDTPLKVQFYYQDNINLPLNTFSGAWQWHRFDFCLIITFLLENWLFDGRFSNCYNSLNFEAMTYWNTSKENFKKWRTKCKAQGELPKMAGLMRPPTWKMPSCSNPVI